MSMTFWSQSQSVLMVVLIHYEDSIKPLEVINTKLTTSMIDLHPVSAGIADGAGVGRTPYMIIGRST